MRRDRLVSGGGDRFEMEALGEGEEEDCSLFKMGLGMIDEEMHSDEACADDGAGEGADGSAEGCSGDNADADSTAVFDSVAFKARAGIDLAFIADAGSGAGGSGYLRIEAIAGTVGQDDRLGAERGDSDSMPSRVIETGFPKGD